MGLDKLVREEVENCEESGKASMSRNMGDFYTYCAPYARGEFSATDCIFLGKQIYQDDPTKLQCYGAQFNRPEIAKYQGIKKGEQLNLFEQYYWLRKTPAGHHEIRPLKGYSPYNGHNQ
jgi:hypothetical protein